MIYDEPDKNIAPWQHAHPIVLGPSLVVKDTSLRDETALQSGNYAALAYLLWDEQYLYAALLSIAPDHDLEEHSLIYEKSAMEIWIGRCQIVLSPCLDGRLDIEGPDLDGDGISAIRGGVHLIDKLSPWSDLSLLPLSGKGKRKAYFLEAAIPWKMLGIKRPERGYSFPLAIGADFGDSKLQHRRFQIM